MTVLSFQGESIGSVVGASALKRSLQTLISSHDAALVGHLPQTSPLKMAERIAV